MSHLQICTKKAKERLLKGDDNETDLYQWLGCVKANKTSQGPCQEILCAETHKDGGPREHWQSNRNNWENSQKRTGVWIGVDASEKARLVQILGLRELRFSHMYRGMLRSIWMLKWYEYKRQGQKGRQEGLSGCWVPVCTY